MVEKKDEINVSKMMEAIRGSLNLPEKAYFLDTTHLIGVLQ